MLYYPEIEPVAFAIFGHQVRWYALMYVAGLLFVHWFLRRAVRTGRAELTGPQLDGVLLTGFLGMLVGARATYVALYNPDFYLANPEQILHVNKGGLAFHGALAGIGLALFVFARVQKLAFLTLTDLVSTAAPLGIALGRIGNFINQELWGRTTDLPWGMVFPNAGEEPRHPSQLYESFLEGWLILAIMLWLYAKRPLLPRGMLTAAFLCLYALARFAAENFREPDVQLGLLSFGLSMGQILSSLMLAVGIAVFFYARRTPRIR